MLSFFPRDVLGEILNLIESVSEGFPTYSYRLAGGQMDGWMDQGNSEWMNGLVDRW